MKRLKQILLWGSGIIVVILIAVALLFYIRFHNGTKSMTPSETGSINDSVWCIRDKFVNAYIFKAKNSFLMIDAGISKNNFSTELKKVGILPEQITMLLLTHTDGDHIGAIGLFKNAAIYMHKDEEQMINGTTGKTKYYKTKWKYGPYNLLTDNDSLYMDGLKIKVIHTQGHTPGSVCYIISGDYLVSGDNLIVSNRNYEHFVEMFNMNTPEQVKSLRLLPAPGTFKYILTGHHGVVKTAG
jgi:glyoxylase-like metal-dependent hydrolase (beta-lactamase superfamily II)